MTRNFDSIQVTPTDVMRVRLDKGDIKLHEFMLWLTGDRSWDSVKESVKQKMIDNAKLQ